MQSLEGGARICLLFLARERPVPELAELDRPLQGVFLDCPRVGHLDGIAVEAGGEAERELLALDAPRDVVLADHLRRIVSRELVAILLEGDGRRTCRAAADLDLELPRT